MDSNYTASDPSFIPSLRDGETLDDPLTMLATVSSQHHSTILEVSASLQDSGTTTNVQPNENRCDPTEESVESILSKLPSDKPYVCAICLKGYDNPTHLQTHEFTHTGNKPFQCDLCGKQFGTKAGLDYHKDTHQEPSVFCDVCKKGFVSEKRLEEHAKCHVEEKSFICDVCGHGFKAAQGLQAHLKLHTGNLKFGCDMCGRKFPGRNALEAHQRTHTGEKPFICDICGMSFRTKGTLGGHYMTHKDEAPFKCNLCERRFKRRDGLEGHMTSHEPPGSFTCNVCGNVYSRLLGLKAHKRTHSRPKAQHACEFCGKTFNRKDNLGIHRRLHTNDMRHQCNLCGRMFTHQCRLNKHLREGHGEADPQDIVDKPAFKRMNKPLNKSINKKASAQDQTQLEVMNEIPSVIPASSNMTSWPAQVTDTPVVPTYMPLQTTGWLQYQHPPDPGAYQQNYSFSSEVYNPDNFSSHIVTQQPAEQAHQPEPVIPISSDVALQSRQDNTVLTVLSTQTHSLLTDSSMSSYTSLPNESLMVSSVSLKDTYHYGLPQGGLNLHPTGSSLPLPLLQIATPAPIPSLAGGTVQPLTTTERSKSANLVPISSMISSLQPHPMLYVPHVEYELNTSQNEQGFSGQEGQQATLTLNDSQANMATAVSDSHLPSVSHITHHEVPADIAVSNDFTQPSNDNLSDNYNSVSVLPKEGRQYESQPDTLVTSHPAEILSHPCSECKLAFKTSVQLAMHVRVHSTSFRPFKCGKCHKDFRSKSALKMHEKTVHVEALRLLTCDTCGKKFKLKRQLKEHQWCHLPEGASQLSCEFCSRTFKVASYLKRHIKRYHGKKTQQCDRCKMHLSSIDLQKHIEKCGAKRDDIMENETREAEANQELKETHSVALHLVNSLSNNNNEPTSEQIEVPKATRKPNPSANQRVNKSYQVRASKLKQQIDKNEIKGCHSTDESRIEDGTDEECVPSKFLSSEDEVSNSPKVCRTNSKPSHAEQKTDIKRNRPKLERTCKVRSLENKTPLLYIDKQKNKVKQDVSHREKNSRENNESNAKLQTRRATKNKSKSLTSTCSLCGRSYSSQSKLRKHVKRIHRLKKYFMCKECQNSFKSGIELREHMVTHMHKKKFQCSLCNASYKFLVNLHRHMSGIHKVTADALLSGNSAQTNNAGYGEISSGHGQTGGNKMTVGNSVDKDEQMTFNVTANSIMSARTDLVTIVHPDLPQITIEKVTNKTETDRPHKTRGNSLNMISSNKAKQISHYCKKCRLTFKNYLRLSIHLRNVHFRFKGKCCFKCGNCFKSKNALYAHYWSHKHSKKRECSDCAKPFKLFQLFINHLNHKHSKQLKAGQLLQNHFGSDQSVRRLLGTNHASYTKYWSSNSKELGIDISRTVHRINESIENSSIVKTHICKKCKEAFMSRQLLMKHMLVHYKEKKNAKQKVKNTPLEERRLGKDFSQPINSEANVPTVGKRISSLTTQQKSKCLECPKCSMFFKTKYRLKCHMQVVHTLERKFKCDKCEKRFKVKRHLMEHIATHQPMDGSIFCKVCKATFLAPHLLQRHMRRRHGEKKFPCPHSNCDKGFPEQGQLTQHLKAAKHAFGVVGKSDNKDKNGEAGSLSQANGKGNLACRFCGKKSKCKTNLDDHEQTHLPPAFFCGICGHGFSVQYYLKRHLKRHKEQQCHLCEAKFTMWKDLRSHLTMIHGTTALKPAEGTDRNAINDASSNEKCEVFNPPNKSEAKKNRTQQDFICEVCGAIFKRRPAMEAHLLRHTGERPYQCDECGATFRTRSTLRGHRVQHTGKYKFFCDICNLGCPSKSRLVAHKRTHTGERPFDCTVCGLSFATKGILQGHFATHQDNTPFTCDICGRGFKRKDGLEGHKASHEVPGNFPCDICGKVYTRLSGMKQHRRTHVNTPVFHNCQICGKSFNRKDNLNVHMKLHTNQLNFVCQYCEKAFSHKCRLEKHIRNNHNNSVNDTPFPTMVITQTPVMPK